MSADMHWRFPGPWDPTRLRGAIDEAARALGARQVEVTGAGHDLRVVAWWPADTVRRWRVLPEEDGSVDHGELSLAWDDAEPEPWAVSAAASTLDDEPFEVRVLAVDPARLASHGLRAVYAAGCGAIGCLDSSGPLLAEPLDRDCEPCAIAVRGDEAWAVASGATVLRRTAAGWTAQATPATGELHAVAFVEGVVWVGGDSGVWQLDGARWFELDRPSARAIAGSAPWLIGSDTAWDLEPKPHAIGEEITAACAVAGAPWLGTRSGRVLRWDGREFAPVDVGAVGAVRAMCGVAGGALVSVSHGWHDDAPALLHVWPGAMGRVHVGSSRGGTGATWGVTCELATRIVRALGGIADDL